MTPHLEAPGDTVVDAAISEMRHNVDGWLDGGPFTFWEDTESVVAAVRAQVDEDVRALVEASAAAMSALDRVEIVSGFYEESSSIQFYCPECEAEAGWRSNGTLKAAHEAGCELAATASSLRAALEPFQATTVEEGRDG